MPPSIRNLSRLPEATLASYKKILLTGATGRVGVPLLARLAELGFSVRAATPDQPPQGQDVEWVQMDFLKDTDFTAALDGVSHVLHLGAELWDPPKMLQINAVATEALAAAAEAAGVEYFCYTSSICTYGSPRRRHVTEETEQMPSEHATAADYLESDLLIEYGRTKLLGEKKIKEHARHCAYVFFRPTEITWEKDILRTGKWSLFTRMWRGARQCHQVYYRDVINAIIFFLLRSADPARRGAAGAVEVYNLSNDDAPDTRFADFMRKAHRELGDKRFWVPFTFPGWLDYLKDHWKWRTLSPRFPFGMAYIDPAKLYATGYQHEYGLADAQRRAIEQIRTGNF